MKYRAIVATAVPYSNNCLLFSEECLRKMAKDAPNMEYNEDTRQLFVIMDIEDKHTLSKITTPKGILNYARTVGYRESDCVPVPREMLENMADSKIIKKSEKTN